MTERLESLTSALEDVTSISRLGEFIDRVRGVYDLEHLVYYAVSLGQSVAPVKQMVGGMLSTGDGFWQWEGRSLAAMSYSWNWATHYAESGYARIDPTLEGAASSFVPVDWKAVAWDTPKRRTFLREAVESGVGNQGYTIPVRGPDGQFAAVSINKTCTDVQWASFLQATRSDFLIIAHYMHQKVNELCNSGAAASAVKLSSREKDVLTYLSVGKSRAQIAHELAISENTLRVYLDSARHKLGALNVPHAVSIAICRGYLNCI